MKRELICGVATPAADLADAVRAQGAVVAQKLFLQSSAAFRELAAKGHPPARLSGPLLTEHLVLHEHLRATLESLLGENFCLARLHLGRGAGDVLATGRSRAGLFSEPGMDERARVFSATLFVPLHDVKIRVVRKEAEHASEGDVIDMASGDALIVDSRRAAEVLDAKSGPALLATFARHWFREPRSTPDLPPIEVAMVDYLRLSAKTRPLVRWRFDRYLQQRPLMFAYQLAEKLPQPLRVPIKRKLRGWASSY